MPGSGNWPPDDEVVSVALSAAQWSLACATIDHWATYSDDDESRALDKVRDLIAARMSQHAI